MSDRDTVVLPETAPFIQTYIARQYQFGVGIEIIPPDGTIISYKKNLDSKAVLVNTNCVQGDRVGLNLDPNSNIWVVDTSRLHGDWEMVEGATDD